MMTSPAATTSTRPPGQASTPVVACSWDCELDEPEPSATSAALTARAAYTTALAPLVTCLRTRFAPPRLR
jgi:hypothetical protein